MHVIVIMHVLVAVITQLQHMYVCTYVCIYTIRMYIRIYILSQLQHNRAAACNRILWDTVCIFSKSGWQHQWK